MNGELIMKDLDPSVIINQIKKDKEYLESQFGVTKIGLFGSFASGQYHAGSDIDFFVEFKQPSFDYYTGLCIYLEKKFNRKVEIVRKRESLNSRFVSRVEKEVIYA
jgi:predicted nucleotidyltransferase